MSKSEIIMVVVLLAILVWLWKDFLPDTDWLRVLGLLFESVARNYR